ncbi:hypothetical protein SVA_3221 [Sulfurifustis variabilis]|uniref:Zinc resistance-associated protein n=1 Tax=Sulfurifustis variabilis TaxID=1675686 RepID=A0A1B4V8B0_9GAMM|nr:hypothetical protein [Sulfurifustis variabilis]BAU49769.1 hypothetical protein SVA_3221 [Sulfurifustis variabilis]
MTHFVRGPKLAALLLLGLALTLPGPAWTDDARPAAKPGAAAGLQPLSGLMRDMAEQMRVMAEATAEGQLSAAERGRIAERMRRMADLMTQMSGLANEAALADVETQARMLDMRREMDWMRRNPPRRGAP